MLNDTTYTLGFWFYMWSQLSSVNGLYRLLRLVSLTRIFFSGIWTATPLPLDATEKAKFPSPELRVSTLKLLTKDKKTYAILCFSFPHILSIVETEKWSLLLLKQIILFFIGCIHFVNIPLTQKWRLKNVCGQLYRLNHLICFQQTCRSGTLGSVST